MPSVRDTVMGWDENKIPTIEQLLAAIYWWDFSRGKPARDEGKVLRLLLRFQTRTPVPRLEDRL